MENGFITQSFNCENELHARYIDLDWCNDLTLPILKYTAAHYFFILKIDLVYNLGFASKLNCILDILEGFSKWPVTDYYETWYVRSMAYMSIKYVNQRF